VRPAAPPKAPPHAADSSIPDTWDKSKLTQMETPPAAPKAPPPGFAPTMVPGARPAAPPQTLHRPVDPPAASPPPAASAGGGLDLEELLRAAGLNATQMSPEMARELGQVLRIVVEGVMEVLQSRAEIKSQLRMSMTRMQATENNPLKFSPNVEAALHTLLVERNRGYLPTIRAFQEALTDIRNHQIAVLSGIRTAFDSMLEQFDPEKLSEEFERQSKRGGGLLNLGAKGRFRDQYIEQFASLTKDPDESFRRLFGEAFAQAYEDQMDRLKAAGRTAGGTGAIS
jgi:type VI secretion system FHA domain protein